MHTQLATQMDVRDTAPGYTMAVSMAGANASQADVVVFAVVNTLDVRVAYQGSDDLQNWTDLSTPVTLSPVGFTYLAAETGVTTAYVRMRVIIGSKTDPGQPAAAIASVGLNTSIQ